MQLEHLVSYPAFSLNKSWNGESFGCVRKGHFIEVTLKGTGLQMDELMSYVPSSHQVFQDSQFGAELL